MKKFWNRVKVCWKILRGKEVAFMEVSDDYGGDISEEEYNARLDKAKNVILNYDLRFLDRARMSDEYTMPVYIKKYMSIDPDSLDWSLVLAPRGQTEIEIYLEETDFKGIWAVMVKDTGYVSNYQMNNAIKTKCADILQKIEDIYELDFEEILTSKRINSE